MPRLVSKKIRGRPTFDYELYKKAGESLWHVAKESPKLAPGANNEERFAKLVDALALHLSGMELRQAALSHGFTYEVLYKFKNQWTRRDATLAPVLANLLMSGATKAMVVFHKKADDMKAPEAAQAAATLTKSAVVLRQGEATDYKPPEYATHALLDRITRVLENAKEEPKQIEGKTYDIDET